MGNYIQKIASLLIVACILSIGNLQAQAPLGFNYQGVALTNAGTPVASKKIALKISLIESQQLGTVRFQEVHNVNTDAYGQFSVIIGNGQAISGKMEDVQWSKFPYYMKVELDLDGGTAFVFVGTSQLLSVPYALYANNAGAASISVDSLKLDIATIKLTQKGDSLILNNNRGSVYIPKIDSLTKIVSQIAGIKSGVIKYLRDSATKTPYGLAIGYDALKGMDTLAANANNYAIGNGAGGSLIKNKDNSSNNDNILIGTASGATLGTTASGGAIQNVIIGNNAGQNAKADATANVLVGYEAGKNSAGSIGSKTVQYSQNVAVGTRALQSAKNAGTNVSIGANNLKLANDVSRNVSIGANTALNYNGDDNVILGTEMLYDTSSNGSKNVIIGAAVATNLRGSGNVILGYKAASDSLFLNTNNKLIIANDKTKTPLIYGEFDNKTVTINGDLTVTGKLNGSSGTNSTFTDKYSNVFLGKDAGINYQDNGLGANTAIGTSALQNNIYGMNVAIGANALKNGSEASYNTAIGINSMYAYKKGYANVAIGHSTLSSLDSGIYNTALGQETLLFLKSGNDNTGLGWRSLANLKSGDKNLAIGWGSGQLLDTGSNNIFIGSYSGGDSSFKKIDNKLIITNYATAKPLIYGEFDNKKVTINGDLTVTGKLNGGSGSVSPIVQYGSNVGDSIYLNSDVDVYKTEDGRWNRNVYLPIPTTSNNLLSSRLKSTILISSGSSFSFNIKKENTNLNNDIVIKTNEFATFIFNGDKWLLVDGKNSITNDVNGNIAIGDSTLYSNLATDSTGLYNTAIGSLTLRTNTIGANNTGYGYQVLYSNTTGSRNTANGNYALYSNTTGFQNIATGYRALFSNTIGSNNNANGFYSLRLNTTGANNTAYGNYSLGLNTTGSSNTAYGNNSLGLNTTGSNNTANGNNALRSNTIGYSNTGIGSSSLFTNSTGNNNVAIGDSSLFKSTTVSGNTAVGSKAMFTNTTGANNASFGAYSLRYNTTGSNNAAFGYNALVNNSTGGTNTAIGQGSMQMNSTGIGNTAIGGYTLDDNTTGGSNVAIGIYALQANTTANFNTSVGTTSMFKNTTGGSNTALGTNSLFSNITGSTNTAIGASALYFNTTASNNVAVGYETMNNNTTGSWNTAIGNGALRSNTTGYVNIAVGYESMKNNTTGAANVAIGRESLTKNTTATGNVAIGDAALNQNTTGEDNVGIGYTALFSNTTGANNTSIGYASMNANTTGYYNSAIGMNALYSNTTGPNNVAIGAEAMKNNIEGSRNVAIGVGALNANNASVNNALGYLALNKNTSGDANNAFGHQALEQNTTGVNNSGFGHSALAANLVGVGNSAFGYAAAANNKSDYNSAFGMGALGNNQNGSENAAFGSYAITNATGSKLTAIGAKAGESNSTGVNNTYLGASANTSLGSISNSTAIGYNATVTASNQIQLGNTSITDVKTSGVITSSGIGIGTKSNTTAALEINSTTKGFLPPRMTSVQRDAITSPALGLIVFCNNCSVKGQMQYFDGSDWVDMVGNAAISGLNIGTSFQGGKIAYILQSGDPGYDPNRLHGIIAANTDQTTSSFSGYFTGTGVMWQQGTWGGGTTVFDLTNAVGTAIGSGKSNTDLIIAKQTSTGRPFAAAALAVAHNGGSYTDWFLPSKDELNKLYLNRVAIGGFEANWYWTSSEKNDAYAEALNFDTGNFDGIGGYKGPSGTPYKVRAIRTF